MNNAVKIYVATQLTVGTAVDPHINDDRARFDHAAVDHAWLAGRDHHDIRMTGVPAKIAGF